jgi:hypothetical protein
MGSILIAVVFFVAGFAIGKDPEDVKAFVQKAFSFIVSLFKR